MIEELIGVVVIVIAIVVLFPTRKEPTIHTHGRRCTDENCYLTEDCGGFQSDDTE